MEFNKHYDKNEAKHYLEGTHFILHCHHYNSLLHRAITKTPYLNGKKFLVKAASKEFYSTLQDICFKKRASSSSEILKVAEDLYRILGFGLVDLSRLNLSGGTAQASASHLATAYLNKWGKQENPVDDFGLAYVTAAWAVAYKQDVDKCQAEQPRCISCGDNVCEFKIVK